MKKFFSLILSLSLMFSLALPAAAAETREASITYKGISIFLDNRELTPLDEQGEPSEPFIMANRTYLPLRAIAGALALDVEWIPETNTVALSRGGEVSITREEPASTYALEKASVTYRDISVTLDGESLDLGDTEPFIMGGSTYLPLRAIGEALDLYVVWDPITLSVHLLSPDCTHSIVTETLALDREGEQPLSITETATLTYPDRAHTTVRSGDSISSDRVLYFLPDGREDYALLYGADGSLECRESWVYDEEGLLRRFTRDVSEGSENDSCTLYEYKNGRLSRERCYAGDTVPRVHSTDTNYTYNEDGNLTKIYVHYPPGSWDEILFEYDEAGNMVRESFLGYVIDMSFSRYEVVYSYDEAGRLIRSELNSGSVTDYYYFGSDEPGRTVTARYDGKYVICDYIYVEQKEVTP